MPSPVSIRERVCREVARRVAAASGVGTCQRFDQRGNDLAIGGAIIKADFDRAEDGSLGGDDDSITIKTMTLSVFVRVNQREGDSVSTDEAVNRLCAAVEAAVLADARLHEDQTAVPTVHSDLAHESRATAAGYAIGQELSDGLPEVMAGVEFEIQYSHYRTDPCNGPGITELEE